VMRVVGTGGTTSHDPLSGGGGEWEDGWRGWAVSPCWNHAGTEGLCVSPSLMARAGRQRSV
jgi:hypothetical protein